MIFFDHFNKFEAIANKRQYDILKCEILPLFKIFMNNHEYREVNK